MGGVDMLDQQQSYYPVGRAGKKWWRYIIWHLISASTFNAFIVWKHSEHSYDVPKSYDHMHFFADMADGLLNGFCSSFMKRHEELAVRTQQSLGAHRASVTPAKIFNWFRQAKQEIDSVDPDVLNCPEKIFNCDETGFSLDKKDICMLSYLMGQQIFSGTQTQTNRRLAKERTKRHTSYSYMSRSVCRETFKFMLDISQNKLSAVTKHFAAHGLVTRKKNSGGASANTNALTDVEKEQIILSLKGYAEDYYALALPSRMQSFSARDEALLLPSSSYETAHDRPLLGLPKTDQCTAEVQQRHNGMTMEEKAEDTQGLVDHQAAYTRTFVRKNTNRKCGLFGVNCEALPQQINFCIDEGVGVGKGSNAVISYLHHFFENYDAGEMNLSLHCDNCAGQNKSQYVLQYLAWRIITGLHTSVSLHFMLPGHAKFAPDWCFGILKRAFRKAEVHSLQDLSHVIASSTKSGINKAVMVGDEKGAIHVRTYDWQSFFRKHSKPFPGIKSKQHFYLSSSDLGYAKASFTLDEGQERRLILDPAIVNETGPSELVPPGLSDQRKAYLFNSIRPFVDESKKDVLCPDPSS
ncbi:hypothetical protein EGW08_019207 [Elysia chlorotica]|uniref:DUF7869 domain-containing protein n=1 Tax=Elysia chlorotica TaxID=188477 RepID=A0A3S0Z8B7_ELYCH|nr:hypothetical protein EGW08_019207 [Elysia chlorotica]